MVSYMRCYSEMQGINGELYRRNQEEVMDWTAWNIL